MMRKREKNGMQFINEENIFDYAFVNIDTLKRPVKAVCVDFHGYTDATIYSESPAKAKVFGALSPALAGRFFITAPPGKPQFYLNGT